MPRLKLLAASLFLSLASVLPALAQHMIDDAGTFPFNDPMRDLGFASSRPSADAMAMMQPGRGTKSRAMMTKGARRSK
ncbi:MAG: hypothetical protein GY844_03895 [Bradyrhizobium sp.]|nr:hypothetical protein [Bradyrhizobium sp.]